VKVLVAGASGVLGWQILPLLSAAGHDVTSLATSADHADAMRSLSAGVAVADLLDREAVQRVVRNLAPDAVVHMAIAIPKQLNLRKLARDFELTNRLRTEGTRNLLDAADEVGVTRIVSQGLAYAYDPAGADPATEDDPLWQNPGLVRARA
jgi:nucleoside-diphosphate-sugar epimerase